MKISEMIDSDVTLKWVERRAAITFDGEPGVAEVTVTSMVSDIVGMEKLAAELNPEFVLMDEICLLDDFLKRHPDFKIVQKIQRRRNMKNITSAYSGTLIIQELEDSGMKCPFCKSRLMTTELVLHLGKNHSVSYSVYMCELSCKSYKLDQKTFIKENTDGEQKI